MFINEFKNSNTTKFLIILIIGCVIGLQFNYLSNYLLILLFVITFVLIIKRKRHYTYLIIVFTAGYLCSLRINDDPISNPNFLKDEEVKITGKVIEKLSNTEFGKRYIVEGRIIDDKFPQDSYKFLVNSSKTKENYIEPNDKVTIFGKLHIATQKLLPTDFPENQYLKFYSVDFVIKTNEDKISISEKGSNFLFWNTFQIEKIKSQIKLIFSNQNYGLVAALLLGDKSNLEEELTTNYSKTGIIHILSVSGLHIALISSVLFSLLSIIPNPKIKFIIFSFFVAEFVCITNFQIPAVRAGMAAILYSFLLLNKKYPNNLSITSFVNIILIIADPNLLTNPSFLFSGFALYGLAIFYNHFFTKLTQIIPDYGFNTDLITKPLASTLAASIITSVLVAYYFGIYSFIAFLTNIILVPIFSLILLYAIISLIFSIFIPVVGLYLSNIVEFLINLSNNLISLFINYIPTHTTGQLKSITIAAIVAFCLIYIFSFKSVKNLFWRTSLSILLILLYSVIIQENEVNIYENNKYLILSVFAKQNNSSNLALIESKNKLPIHIQNNIKKYLTQVKFRNIIVNDGTNLNLSENGINSKVIILKNQQFRLIKQKLMALK